jgi:hypothetical protein
MVDARALEVWEFYRGAWAEGGPLAHLPGPGKRPGPKQLEQIQARLQDHSVEDLKQVVNGALLDSRRWPERLARMDVKYLYGKEERVRYFLTLVKTGGLPPRKTFDVNQGIMLSPEAKGAA